MPISHHAYCLGYEGVWRVKIPDQFGKHDNPKLKIKCVFTCDSGIFPPDMGLFSSGDNVYMAGGIDHDPLFKSVLRPGYKLYVLNPTSFEDELPVDNPQLFFKPLKLPADEMRHILSPMVVQANQKLYFLTQYDNPWFCKSVVGICFQFYDPSKKSFQILSSPYIPNLIYRPDRPEGTSFRTVAYFAVLGYIYLFIQENYSRKSELAFCFDTTSYTWRQILNRFKHKKFPTPSGHRGDTGISEVFSDGTRILVALCNTTPIAYRVMLGENGSLKPRSFRFLYETNSDGLYDSDGPDGMAQLHDIGSGRFCVIYQSFRIPLKVYVFKIDFDKEHKIQTSRGFSPEKSKSSKNSSRILCSRNFLNDIPFNRNPSFYAYCLASAPASQSSRNRIAPAEKDRERNTKRKRERSPERKRERNPERKRKKGTR